MGNHCIDCDFCGRDQRIAGDHCCPENAAHHAKLEADRAAKRKEDAAFLATFGITVYSDSTLYVWDVVRALKQCGATPKRPRG